MTTDRPTRFADYGLLVLRVCVGLLFMTVHGWPKISGGPETWARFGESFNNVIGISFMPTFWGLMAGVSEFFGGLCLIVGVPLRSACALMLFTMLVAAAANLRQGYGFIGASQALECGAVFVSLILLGPGRFTLPNLFRSKISD